MSGERPNFIHQQPSQPEHTQPLQGSAEGKQSLQGPTTVDRSEQLQLSPGLPPTIHERAKPPPESAVNKPRLTPEERREKKRKYAKDYRKRNKDKVNTNQSRYRREGAMRPNEKLMEYQWRLAEERMAKRREQEANEPSADLGQRDHQQSEAIQIFPTPPEK